MARDARIVSQLTSVAHAFDRRQRAVRSRYLVGARPPLRWDGCPPGAASQSSCLWI